MQGHADGFHGTGNGRVHRNGHKCVRIADFLSHLDVFSCLHQRLAGNADVHGQRNLHHLGRGKRLDGAAGGYLMRIGMYASTKGVGHVAFTSYFSFLAKFVRV